MNDNGISTNILIFILKGKCEDIGLRKFCRKNNLDEGNVSNIINGKKNMLPSVAQALGYEKSIIWVRK